MEIDAVCADIHGHFVRQTRLRIRRERAFTGRAMALLFGDTIFHLGKKLKFSDFRWTRRLETGYLELFDAMDEAVFTDDVRLCSLMRTIKGLAPEVCLLFCAAYHDEVVLDDINFRLFYKDEHDYLLENGCRVYRLEGLRTWRYAVIVRSQYRRGWTYYRVDGDFLVASKLRKAMRLRIAITHLLAGMDYTPLAIDETSALMGTSRYWRAI